MKSLNRILMLLATAFLIIPQQVVAATISISSPSAGTQYTSYAEVARNGIITNSTTTAYIYLQSFDSDGVSVVSSTNATWTQFVRNWTPGTLRAPVGAPPEIVENFEIQADAMNAYGQPQATSARKSLKVKGPIMP